MTATFQTDVPKRKIPDDLVVPDGWKEDDSGGQDCFYGTKKLTYHTECDVCKTRFPGVNLANLSRTYTIDGKVVRHVCGGTCWAKYIALWDVPRCHCMLCVAWHKYVEQLKLLENHIDPFAVEEPRADVGTPMYVVSGMPGSSGSDAPHTLQEIMRLTTQPVSYTHLTLPTKA